jgi:hypothetical protein
MQYCANVAGKWLTLLPRAQSVKCKIFVFKQSASRARFSPQPLYARDINCIGEWGGLQSRFGRRVEKEDLDPTGNRIPNPSP